MPEEGQRRYRSSQSRSHPHCLPPSQLGGDCAHKSATKTGAQGHQGRDELLPHVLQIPTGWRQRVLLSKDLATKHCKCSGLELESGRNAYLQEAGHRLKTCNQAKINAILERTHSDDETRQETSPVGKDALVRKLGNLSHGDESVMPLKVLLPLSFLFSTVSQASFNKNTPQNESGSETRDATRSWGPTG